MGATRSLREAKRAAFMDIVDRLGCVTVSGRPLTAKRSADMLRLEVVLPGDSRGLIALATIKDGLPVGAFAVDPAILVYGGTILSVLRQVPLRRWAHPPPDAVLCAQGEGPHSNRGVYRVNSANSPSIDIVTKSIRSTWIPLLEAFSGGWDKALDHTLTHPQEVAAPFSTAVILAFLAEQSGRVDEVRAVAQTEERFWDARQVLDIDEHIETIKTLVRHVTPSR